MPAMSCTRKRSEIGELCPVWLGLGQILKPFERIVKLALNEEFVHLRLLGVEVIRMYQDCGIKGLGSLGIFPCGNVKLPEGNKSGYVVGILVL